MITTEQIKELLSRLDDLYRHLGIESKKIELEEERTRRLRPISGTTPRRPRSSSKKWLASKAGLRTTTR